MKGKKRRRPTGELRLSQVITTFGPGAMLDLPEKSALVGGLDYWFGQGRPIYEERLQGRLCELLEVDHLSLYEPPVDDPDPTAPQSGINAFLFPTWFLGQVDQTHTVGRTVYRTRPLVPWNRLVRGKYQAEDRKPYPVVPVRFVQACIRGHISDINWYDFVRQEHDAKPVGQLWLDEGGSGNDFSEIFVRDEMTGKRRALSKAMVPNVLGKCRGRQPWLGPAVHEPCTELNRLLTRSASYAYFSQVLSVIAIPDSDAELREAVDRVYEDFLQYAESKGDVARERKKQKVFVALEGFGDDAVWSDVQRRKSGAPAPTKSIKQVEIETLLSQPDAVGEDTPDGDFYARTRSLARLPGWLAERLDRVVLVHRLREVMAQVGFTRFEAFMPDVDGELSLDVRRAPLSRETSWLPAVENHGEGVFLSFEPEAIKSWLTREAVKNRGHALGQGFATWCARHKAKDAKFPGLPYIMLHSLSHLLITAVSLECGYAASSIRERIYAGDSGYGILLYTGAPGSEGTLGGLVEIGRHIEDHLIRALELGRLCSNDPVCAQHAPDNQHEERYLHGAACHGCLLVAETSCERRNELLDRALVVPTVATPGAAFFPGDQP